MALSRRDVPRRDGNPFRFVLRPTFLLLYRLERGRLHARRGRYRTRRVPAVCKGASPFLFGRESLATLGRTLERRPFGAGGRNRGPVPRASGVRRPTPRFRRGARDAVFFFPVVPSAVVPRASLEIPPPPPFLGAQILLVVPPEKCKKNEPCLWQSCGAMRNDATSGLSRLSAFGKSLSYLVCRTRLRTERAKKSEAPHRLCPSSLEGVVRGRSLPVGALRSRSAEDVTVLVIWQSAVLPVRTVRTLRVYCVARMVPRIIALLCVFSVPSLLRPFHPRRLWCTSAFPHFLHCCHRQLRIFF